MTSTKTHFLKIPFKYPDYGKLWAAQAVNNIGSQFTFLALQFLVYNLTKSTLAMGLLAIFQSVPMILVGPYAGVVTDRYDRKKMMMYSNIANACWLFFIPLTKFFSNRIVFIYILAFLMGTTNRFFFPSRAASIPKLVGETDLLSANSLSAATYQVSALIGPITAGFFVSILNYDIAFYIDMFGFLLSAFFIQRIIINLKPDQDVMNSRLNKEQEYPHESTYNIIVTDLKDALSFFRGFNSLKYLLALFGVLLMMFGASLTMMVPYLEERVNTIFLTPEEAFGVMSSLAAVSGLTLAVLVGRKTELSKPLTYMTISTIIGSLIVLGFSNATNFLTLAFFWMFFGSVEVFVMIPYQTLMQETIPDIMRGKVISMFNLVFSVSQITGMAMGGILGELLNLSTTFLIFGLVGSVSSIIFFIILLKFQLEKEIEFRKSQLQGHI